MPGKFVKALGNMHNRALHKVERKVLVGETMDCAPPKLLLNSADGLVVTSSY